MAASRPPMNGGLYHTLAAGCAIVWRDYLLPQSIPAGDKIRIVEEAAAA
jgi:hypothetical protein